MKKKVILLILFVIYISTNEIVGQLSYLPSRPYQEWQINHSSLSSKTIFFENTLVSDTSNGFNCFQFNPNKLHYIQGGNLYLVYSMIIKGDVEGYILAKYDLVNNQLIWQKVFTLNNLIRRELPVALGLNETGNLIVVSLQKREPSDPIIPLFILFAKNTGMVIREFDEEGQLLKVVESNETTKFSSGSNPNGNGYSFFTFNSGHLFEYTNKFFQHSRISYFNKINIDSLNIFSSDSLVQDNTPYVFTKQYALNYNLQNGLFANHYDFIDKFKIAKFDLSGKILKEIQTNSFTPNQFYDYSDYISFVDENFIYVLGYTQIDPFIPPHNYLKIYNHELNLVKSIDTLPLQNFENPQVIRLSKDKKSFYLLTLKKSSDVNDDENYTKIYQIDGISLSFKELISLPFNDSLQFSIPIEFYENDNKILVLYRETDLYYNDFTRLYQQDHYASAMTLAVFDKTVLLGSDVKIYNPFIKIFPNPSNAQINIETDLLYDEILIYDLYGNQALNEHSSKSSLDISSLSNAVYLCELRLNGKLVNKGVQFVKVD